MHKVELPASKVRDVGTLYVYCHKALDTIRRGEYDPRLLLQTIPHLYSRNHGGNTNNQTQAQCRPSIDLFRALSK